MPDNIKSQIAKIFKTEAGRVLATLVRLLGDIDRAEEALQESFAAATEDWPQNGLPANPAAWLISTGKFKAIDAARRATRERTIIQQQLQHPANGDCAAEMPDDGAPSDDRLRLIFFCCHPALPLDARIALALRDVCGMSTAEIARAYLLPLATVKKRIARAKALFKSEKIPYEIPDGSLLPARLNAVLHVIYIIFTEGYATGAGDDHIRRDLTDEAIFLSRMLVEISPAPESLGLLALLLLQEARRRSRLTNSGEIIPLAEQDRSRWDQSLIHEALPLIQRAIRSGRIGPYTLQAAIVAVHATATTFEQTRWDVIVDYYDMLLKITPSPIIRLNRAIAVGMDQGPQIGLEATDALLTDAGLAEHHLLHAARAHFLMQTQQIDQAKTAYRQALKLVHSIAEQKYLERELAKLGR